MDARSEFFVYMGASLATIAGLFAVQIWYASYLDVAVVHAPNLDAPADAKVIALRDQERAKLQAAAVPIAEAMKAVAARGRAAGAKLAPQASDDLSAMSGWAHRKGFAAYEPRAPQAPSVPVTEASDGGVPAEGAEGAEPQGAAPAAPADAPVKKIAVGVAKPLPAKPAAKPKAAAKIAAPAPTPAPAAAPQTP
jgi:hypothetical protein